MGAGLLHQMISSGFDWGSFLGAIVGVLGTYVIAWKSFNWGRRDSKLRRLKLRVRLIGDTSDIIYQSYGHFLSASVNNRDGDLQKNLDLVFFKVIKPLRESAIQAMAVDTDIYEWIDQIRVRAMNIFNEYFPNPFKKSASTNENLEQRSKNMSLQMVSLLTDTFSSTEEWTKKCERDLANYSKRINT